MRTLRLLTLTLIASAALFAARPAQAGLLLEPYAGYEFGTLKYTGNPNSTLTLSAPAIGARAGYMFHILFVAADFNTLVSGSSKDDPGNKYDTNSQQLFIDVGAQLPMIRGYVGYGVMNWIDVKSSSTTTRHEGGTAIKAGIGTKVAPMVAVNLEYQNWAPNKVAGASTSNYKSDLFMINVSVPLTF